MNRRQLRISINDRLIFLEQQIRNLLWDIENRNMENAQLILCIRNELNIILRNWKFIRDEIKKDLYDLND